VLATLPLAAVGDVVLNTIFAHWAIICVLDVLGSFSGLSQIPTPCSVELIGGSVRSRCVFCYVSSSSLVTWEQCISRPPAEMQAFVTLIIRHVATVLAVRCQSCFSLEIEAKEELNVSSQLPYEH